jgi:hypothetical protein
MITLFWILFIAASAFAATLLTIIYRREFAPGLRSNETFKIVCLLGLVFCSIGTLSIGVVLGQEKEKENRKMAANPEATHSCPFCGNSFEIKFSAK